MRKIKRPTPISPEQWEQVGDFVTEHISQAPEAASDTLHGLNVLSLSRYAVWVLDQGLDLDPEYVFDKGLVFDHCGTYSPEGLKGTTLRAHFGRLRKVARHFNSEIPVRASTGSSLEKKPPYSDEEIKLLVSWAEGDGHKEALLALCLGAGIRYTEAAHVSWSDITIDELGVLVSAGQPSRVIPVLAEFDHVLRAEGKSGYLLFPESTAKRRHNEFSRYLGKNPAEIGIVSPRRLRKTWLSKLINSGLPDSVFCEVAGVTSVSSYEKLRTRMPSIMAYKNLVREARP